MMNIIKQDRSQSNIKRKARGQIQNGSGVGIRLYG
jgi:hypothetical protein